MIKAPIVMIACLDLELVVGWVAWIYIQPLEGVIVRLEASEASQDCS